jgi:HAMP domain-containing protein
MPSRRPGLKTLASAGGALLMLVPAIVAGSLYTDALQRQTERLLVEKLTDRGVLSSGQLARRLYQLWREVDTLARSIDVGDLPRTRQNLDFIGSLDQRYSWLGVTNLEGKVLAASRGMLEGESVAQRLWFRRGLIGPTAVDVHEAQLLARLLPTSSEPYRFIDLAAPLRGQGSAVNGVVGAHLDWRWVIETLRSLEAPGTEIILLSRDRIVLHGPPDLQNKPLNVGSALAANRATTSVLDERWPDGKDYLTVVVPVIGFADLPSFGWSLLIRQSHDEALAPTRQLVKVFWSTLGAGALIGLSLLFLAAHWISTPLRRLCTTAEALAADEVDTPAYRESRYAEVERLSAALTRVQSRLMNAKHPP